MPVQYGRDDRQHVGGTAPIQRCAVGVPAIAERLDVLHGYLAECWREYSNTGRWDPASSQRWYREIWIPQIPTGCGCAEHWARLTDHVPIDWSSPAAAFKASWHLHNLVSTNHSRKPTISLAEAQGLFRCPVPRRPRAVITCAIGDHYLAVLELTRPLLKAYAQRCGAEYLEITDDLRPDWPMANKYRMAHLAWHYEQSLLIDCDVIVRSSSPDIFDAAGDAPIAGRDERPDYRDDWYINEASEFYASQDVQFQIERCMNAGVMVFRRDALDRYSEPPKPYPKYWCNEQFWLYYQTRDVPMRWLDDRFNWAAIRNDFDAGLANAWFIHLNGIHDPNQRIATLTALT